MKKFFKVIAVVVFAAIIGFSLTGCSDGRGGGNDSGKKPVFSVSGEFDGAIDGKALFKAKTAENRSARAAATTYELTGELEDGDMVFRLKGTYDSSDGSYIVSSASSFARYTVNGNASGATATLAVKDGDEWKSFVVSVTIKEVTVNGDNVVDTEGGLPAWARGSWHDWYVEDKSNYNYNAFEAWSYFDQWYYEAYRSSVWRDNWDFTKIKYTVIDAKDIGDGVYDVIFSYPLYRATRDQKMAALKQFFEEKKHPAKLWNCNFDPWDHDVWTRTDAGVDYGKNYDDSLIWYICKNENHDTLYTRVINWDTFYEFFGTIEEQDEFWAASGNGDLWERKDAVELFLSNKGIQNYYYYGWHEADYDESVSYEDRSYTCWAPSCEDTQRADGSWGGWWDITRYYSKWGNQTGIMGDWDKNGAIFQKWNEEDYLVNFLIGKVESETWYTRVRMWKEGDALVVFYYNGDNEAQQNEHSAPACDTRSLSKIQGLTSFDPESYPDWSYYWYPPQRTVPRGND